eukprot:TRINITY_DN2926_c0_g1_i1.p1 TRINITY_DN2926_c0_g1~~TRINITY_DN2926_c0_g1_i1.p1  ORF type:complete len:215 (+),score=38.84 TRINITY_DN2926_c0_g1_i1:661-1305(+)
METGQCRYGTKCQFAHGNHEIRNVLRHPKYKTEICRTFHTTGTCAYGRRCRFVHHVGEIRTNDGTNPNMEFHLQLGQLKLGNLNPSTLTGNNQTPPQITSSSNVLYPSSPRGVVPLLLTSSSAIPSYGPNSPSMADFTPPGPVSPRLGSPFFPSCPLLTEEDLNSDEELDLSHLRKEIEAVAAIVDDEDGIPPPKRSTNRLPFFVSKFPSWRRK